MLQDFLDRVKLYCSQDIVLVPEESKNAVLVIFPSGGKCIVVTHESWTNTQKLLDLAMKPIDNNACYICNINSDIRVGCPGCDIIYCERCYISLMLETCGVYTCAKCAIQTGDHHDVEYVHIAIKKYFEALNINRWSTEEQLELLLFLRTKHSKIVSPIITQILLDIKGYNERYNMLKKLRDVNANITLCDACLKIGTVDKPITKKCANCYSVTYCNVMCQTNGWAEHKSFCINR